MNKRTIWMNTEIQCYPFPLLEEKKVNNLSASQRTMETKLKIQIGTESCFVVVL
jgi:hypothetical protein